jgi:serine/threonine-protein kinase RsbW
VTRGSDTLLFSAPPSDVDAVHDFLHGVWRDDPGIDETDRMAFETALIELASNVIQHADAEGVTCVLSVKTEDGHLRAQLSDTAEAGGVRLVGVEMPDDLAESGRGIAFIQLLVDDLSYERVDGRNVWSIAKKRTLTQ